jgi:hypothetical protein
MLDEIHVPPEGVRTEEWVWGRHAFVWWDREAFLAFPAVGDRRTALSKLEAEMINCGTATLYYHAAKIGGEFVVVQSGEDERTIYINVRLGQPIMLDAALADMLRAFYVVERAAQDG